MAETYRDQRDRMLNMPPGRLIAKLSVPTVISMLVSGVYNLGDTFFVGKLGTSASGAVGVVFSYMAILQAFGFMCGQGSGALAAQRLGAGRREEASVIGSTGFFIDFLIGAVLEVLTLIFLSPLAEALGSTETIRPYAMDYMFWIAIAAPFLTTSLLLNNILRYEGYASLAMIGLMAGGLLNLAGDPLFMFVFGMGISGAGLSTALSQIISFAILLSMFLRGRTQTQLSLKNVSLRSSMIVNILKVGFPSLTRQGLGSLSTMLLNRSTRLYGDAAVAGMSIVGRITMLTFTVVIGIGQGFQPVAAFNFGAKKYGRLRQAFHWTLLFQELTLVAFVAVCLSFSGELIGVFRDDPEVIAIGTPALRYALVAQLTQALVVATNMLYQSTGRAGGATFMSMLRSGIVFIPVLLIMRSSLGLHGIQIAQPVSDCISFVLTIPFVIRYFQKYSEDEKA
ncbi:MAG: MATE family efflux transporter [Lachnospiraceae bacterium]|nr:MATE family efflux transporter [Lachnospiraceae bacterium]MCH4032198.1 MATE family efflux transporter [Lachnospiraceae bacterium]MCH4108924.1 MATE family efflux transporter [Lachnospiraceae bacterium]MCI1332326.1 MATE family efflux transporter [Lachnospiraceae bacterium]MCI1361723.1 MATE family efflux transporter [Lachnospiraceae bacterium]